MVRRLFVLFAVMGLGVAFVATAAHANLAIPKWQSLTCKENKDLPTGEFGVPEPGYESTLPAPTEQCTDEETPENEARWFTQAAGHPNFGITDFRLATLPNPPTTEAGGFPTGFIKEIVVDTPEGLSVNPEALPQCTIAQLTTLSCPSASLVGTNYLTVSAQQPNGEGKCTPSAVAGECLQARVKLPVYNLVPFDGVPSMVGFLTEAGPTFIVGSLDPVDQHVTFTIEVHPPSATSPPIIESRLVFNGRAGNGTYLTMPSNCAGGQTTLIHLLGQGGIPPFEPVQSEASAEFTTAVGASGCELVPFDPTIHSAPQDGFVDSPEASTVDVGIPFDPTEPIANSYLKTANVVLPEGTGLNPASGAGLQACTDAEFAKGTDDPITCPPASKVGTVEVQTPSLPADSLTGEVYVGQPLSNDPSTGEQFRIFIHAGSERYAVNVRLEGKLYPNLATGQLTAVVDENPQATFSSFKLRLNGGPKGTLTTPPTCGPHTTNTTLTPWSGEADAHPSSAFVLTSDPSGGTCPATLGARSFAPVYTSKSDDNTANAYSPFRVRIVRQDGEQEMKVVDVTLPAGLSGKIAGIPYCPEGAIAAAAGKSGAAELASPSCSAASEIGNTTTAAGSGSAPIKVAGKAYLAGPYKGAPLSMVVITPAVAGPYDLGTVVVRVALDVDPETTLISANSDVIPNLLGGVKLDIRQIYVDLDRGGFIHNPTNCRTNGVTGVIQGGGSNPANPAAFSNYAFDAQYATSNCHQLNFKPKLGVKLLGGRKAAKRRGHPRIQAVLRSKENEANVNYTALTLPPTMLLDNSHIKTICTRVQLAAEACPSGAVYGHATASSPLIEGQLSGPVYLVSSNNKLPDLLADMRGQVNVRLRGVISTVKGGLKTTFKGVPDAPVSKFVLKMQGGGKGLIINAKDLCKAKPKARLNIRGQNAKNVKNNKFKIQTSCGKKKKKK
jgi:hypothetical protein